jgi:hypothetical protein
VTGRAERCPQQLTDLINRRNELAEECQVLAATVTSMDREIYALDSQIAEVAAQ